VTSDTERWRDRFRINLICCGSTATTVHKNVPTYAEDVGWWHIDDFRDWAREAIALLRRIRSTFTGPGNIEWRDQVRQELIEQSLDPRSIIAKATHTRLRDVPIE
jgi:hypothetical protein